MKIKKVVIIAICMIMFCIPSVFAGTTILNRQESSENNVKLSISQTNGYVTSLNFSVKIEGNVKLDKIIWDSSLKDDYFKKYTYSEATKTLDVYIVAPNKQNLVNDDLTINVATLVFSTQNDNESYNVLLSGNDTNIVMMNNYYDKIVENGTDNNNNKFIAHVSQVTPPDDNNDDNNNSGNTNNGNNNANNNINSNTNGNTTNNNVQNNTVQNNTVQNSTIENNIENVGNSIQNDVEQEFNNKVDEEKQKDDNKNSTTPIIFICVGALLLVICTIVIIRIRHKK